MLGALSYMFIGYSPSGHTPYDDTDPGGISLNWDSDGDGMNDSFEKRIGTNPYAQDSDKDGINDGVEYQYWSNEEKKRGDPKYGPEGDIDGDGVKNILDPDSDNDGMKDGAELAKGTDPSNPDTDGDGVPDGYDKNPLSNADKNNNGLPDDWEWFTNETDPFADPDKDGVPNIDEYKNGTNPHRKGNGTTCFNFASGDMTEAFGNATDDPMMVLFYVYPASNPRYWRCVAFDEYTGRTWKRTALDDDIPYSGSYLSDEVRYSTGSKIGFHTITFFGYTTGFIPTALHTSLLVDLAPPVEVSRDPAGAFSTDMDVMTYSFESWNYFYSDSVLMNASTQSPEFEAHYFQVPPSLPMRVRALAFEITSGLRTPYEKVNAIQNYIVANYEFNYSLMNATRLGEYGDMVDWFLFGTKQGVSFDFAGAFVTLCRLNGIPARLATGFAPGEIEGGRRIVRMGHLHAWAEVEFAELGWVPFEVTSQRYASGANSSCMHVDGYDAGTLMTPFLPTLDTKEENSYAKVSGNGGGTCAYTTAWTAEHESSEFLGDKDTDGDKLPDAYELAYGTDPTRRDTDGDGISDAEELEIGSNPTLSDTDNDGLLDGAERELGSDPTKADTDGGGALDGDEALSGHDPLDPSDDDLTKDTDRDGLPDGVERTIGTNPNYRDTDGDGLSDGFEVSESGPGTNPNDPDTDGDGLSDGYEYYRLGTDPTNVDTDSDGLTDKEELLYETDPTYEDTDCDGLTDGEEVALGTDPNNSDTDGDGVIDGVEKNAGLDPKSKDSNNDGIDDKSELENRENSTIPQPPPEQPNAQFDLAGLQQYMPIIACIAAVIALVAVFMWWRNRHIPEVRKAFEVGEKELSAEDLEDDDIRQAILKAYKAMCGALDKFGFGRKVAWTPIELERAACNALPVDHAKLRTLTAIFEEARYSRHTMGDDARLAALNCFRGIKEDLESAIRRETELAHTSNEPVAGGA